MFDPPRTTRHRCILLLLLALAVFAEPTEAQHSRTVQIAGGASSDGMLRGPGGAHAMLGVIQPLSSHIDLRASGFGAWGGWFREAMGDRILGTSIGLRARMKAVGSSPYLGAGLTWTDTRYGEDHPFQHDLGVGGTLGFEFLGIGGHAVFVEFHTRFFGNLFMDRATTRSLSLYTVGMRF